METNKIYNMDCIEGMKQLPDNFVDSIVTDPPYGLVSITKRYGKENSAPAKSNRKNGNDGFRGVNRGFMGKTWDGSGIEYNVDMWKECFRVLKSGGHLLSFGGTRTYHRMACAIEDAGFEVRDQIIWCYGSGFPKSMDISKAIDKKPKANLVKDFKNWLKIQFDKVENKKDIEEQCGFTIFSYSKTDNKDYWSSNLPTKDKWEKIKKYCNINSDEWDFIIENNVEERGFIETTGGLHGGRGNTVGRFTGNQLSENAISPESKQWRGWGTALKPAHEPIVLARKPLSEKTIAQNVLKFGTGGINIDGCRIESGTEHMRGNVGAKIQDSDWKENSGFGKPFVATDSPLGRFPSNFIHDGSEEILKCFPNVEDEDFSDKSVQKTLLGDIIEKKLINSSRFFYCAKASTSERDFGCEELEDKDGGHYAQDEYSRNHMGNTPDNKREPVKNNHPTVKPLSLMRYLITLVTQPNGLVMDMFAGSGSTLVACKQLKMNFIGFELNPDYCKIAEKRIESIKFDKTLQEF